jgi:hypothetical protein
MHGFYVASAKQMVALLDLENTVVFTTDHAVLVARRQAADSLRRVVARPKEVARTDKDYQKVHPPGVATSLLSQAIKIRSF